jgi:hypothetical protein
MLCLVFLASVTGSSPASPTPEGVAPTTQPEVHAVTDIAFALWGDWPELSVEALEPALASSLVDLGIAVAVTTHPVDNVFVQLDWARRVGAQRRGRAVFWLVRRDAETIQLFVLPPGTDLGYVRDIPAVEGSDELAESLAVIVRGAAESLRAGAPSGMRGLVPEPEPEPPLEPEPPREPDVSIAKPTEVPKPDQPHFRLGIHYLGTSLAANDAPWQSGAALDVGVRFPVHLTAAVTAGWTTGQARDEATVLRIQRVPLGVAVGYGFDPSRKFTGRIMAIGVAEVMWWTPDTSLEPGLDVRIGLGARADLVVGLYRGLGLVVSAAGVGWLRNLKVEIDEGGLRRTVLHPHPIGAEVRLGVQYEF